MAHLRVAGWASSGYCAVILGVDAGMTPFLNLKILIQPLGQIP